MSIRTLSAGLGNLSKIVFLIPLVILIVKEIINGNNNFNALQVSVQRRFTNGWLWQTQYMWSHAISDASAGAGESFAYQNQACRACDRSNSGFDVRHTTITNSVYELPFGQGRKYMNNRGLASQVFGGWELSGVFTARTGLPVDIQMKPQTRPPDGNTKGQRPGPGKRGG